MESNPLKILIVSNDNNLNIKLDAILRKNGFNPIIFTSGKKAIQFAQNNLIPLALIDLHLKNHSTLDVLKSIMETSNKIKCITLADNASSKIAHQSEMLGAFPLFKNPLFESQMILTINSILEKINAPQAMTRVNKGLSEFINRFQDGIVYVSIDGHILGFNEVFQKMVGYSNEELKKMTFMDLTPEKWHPLEENIALTKEIVKVAHAVGVSVEAELGRLMGVEDEISVDAREAILTDPDEAVRFVEETGCDTLAIAIGTSHGAYKFKGEPRLAFDRLEEIAKKVSVPLVLHGASSVKKEIVQWGEKYGAKFPGAAGVPDEHIKKAISLGITKVNIDTDLRLSFTAGVREFLQKRPEVFDPRKILGAGKEAMKRVISQKIDILGSQGKG